MEIPILADVRRHLSATKRHWPEVAQRSGVPRTTIHRVAHGYGNPTVRTVGKLYAFFQSSDYQRFRTVIESKKAAQKGDE